MGQDQHSRAAAQPTVGVDPQSRDRIYAMLGELARDGVSLILTTHHLEEAEARCSRTVIIDHGKVIESGTLPELVDRTVGRHRLVTLRLAAPVPSFTAGGGATIEIDNEDACVLRARMTDVAGELPPLLQRIRAAGGAVDYHLFEGSEHQWVAQPGPQTEKARAMVKAFIARQLKSKS